MTQTQGENARQSKPHHLQDGAGQYGSLCLGPAQNTPSVLNKIRMVLPKNPLPGWGFPALHALAQKGTETCSEVLRSVNTDPRASSRGHLEQPLPRSY